MVTNSFSEKVINWYELHGRHDLQWRKAITPYRIWISEIMLQQTQVVTVEPYFKKFIKKYPTLKSIKNASEDEILTLWSGLGFYKRARNIFQTKEIIHSEHKGRFPKTFEEIIKLPGIGKSTAGAIMSIAHQVPTPILDGNVKRILQRYFSDGKNVFSEKELWDLSSSVSIATNSNLFTQGIMDIGATVCTPQNPECSRCPISANCSSAFLKVEATKSKRIIDLKTIKMELSLFVADQEVLLRKVDDQEILFEAYEFSKNLRKLFVFRCFWPKKLIPNQPNLFPRGGYNFSGRIASAIEGRRNVGGTMLAIALANVDSQNKALSKLQNLANRRISFVY